MPEIQLPTKVVQDQIDTKATGIKTVVDGIKTGIDSLLLGRVIKSVQRGVVIGNNGMSVGVSIAAVNPGKCLIILEGVTASDGTNPVVYSFASTSFTISAAYSPYVWGTNASVSWQVIEFY